MFNFCVSMFRSEWWIWIWPAQQTSLLPVHIPCGGWSTHLSAVLSAGWHIRQPPRQPVTKDLLTRVKKMPGLLLQGGIPKWCPIHCRILWETRLKPDKIHLHPTPVPRFSYLLQVLPQVTSVNHLHKNPYLRLYSTCQTLSLWASCLV